jgi:hypothetical protein
MFQQHCGGLHLTRQTLRIHADACILAPLRREKAETGCRESSNDCAGAVIDFDTLCAFNKVMVSVAVRTHWT